MVLPKGTTKARNGVLGISRMYSFLQNNYNTLELWYFIRSKDE
jgi:hypothetical protein